MKTISRAFFTFLVAGVFAFLTGLAVTPKAWAYGGLITNGDFENGHSSWVEAYSDGLTLNYSSNIIQNGNNGGGGNYYAYLFSMTGYQDVMFSSDFVLPSNSDYLTLNFDSKGGATPSCSVGLNSSYVGLYDSTAAESVDSRTIHDAVNEANSYDYSTRTLELGSGMNTRSGHTMRLTFSLLHNDSSCNQVLFLDNISLYANTPVYRMANWMTHERLFTTNWSEVVTIKDKNGWVHEGISFKAKKSGTAVYRMANWMTHERLFTTDWNEVQAIKDRNGWVHEGTAFYAEGSGVPVYRMANWMTHERLFTTDWNEVQAIKDRNGWVHEGTAFYAN